MGLPSVATPDKSSLTYTQADFFGVAATAGLRAASRIEHEVYT